MKNGNAAYGRCTKLEAQLRSWSETSSWEELDVVSFQTPNDDEHTEEYFEVAFAWAAEL